jgi:endonuclease G, mitochondrial
VGAIHQISLTDLEKLTGLRFTDLLPFDALPAEASRGAWRPIAQPEDVAFGATQSPATRASPSPRLSASKTTNFWTGAPLPHHGSTGRNMATAAATLAEVSWRVLGGRAVRPDEFRSCCCIGSAMPGGAVDWFGSAVIVHRRALLTAAHCEEHGPINRLLVGANRINSIRGSYVLPIDRVVAHPLYQKPRHDLAVLIVDRDLADPPAPLAGTDEVHRASKCELVGFGYSDPDQPFGFGVKRAANAPITAIQRSTADDLGEACQLIGFDAEHEFVAGRKHLGVDTCEGDSGGPVYIEGTERLIGVTSRATKTRERCCGDGGVYLRVDRYRDWIEEVLAALNGVGG